MRIKPANPFKIIANKLFAKAEQIEHEIELQKHLGYGYEETTEYAFRMLQKEILLFRCAVADGLSDIVERIKNFRKS